jgi:hypothetical protein
VYKQFNSLTLQLKIGSTRFRKAESQEVKYRDVTITLGKKSDPVKCMISIINICEQRFQETMKTEYFKPNCTEKGLK